MIAAHSMHSRSRRRRRGADINILRRSRVVPPRRTKQKLPQIHYTAADISSDQIRIHLFQHLRREHASRHYALPEPRCEAFDLRLKPLQHVEIRSMRDVTVSPRYMLSLRSAARVK